MCTSCSNENKNITKAKVDSDKIKNMYFVGRNYLKHIEELNNEKPEYPLIFTKPMSSLCRDGILRYPIHSNSVHFEGEMVFMVPQENFKLDNSSYVFVGCGLDFTARDVQNVAKSKGLPWFGAKCFSGSAIISDYFAKVYVDDLNKLEIRTIVDGEVRQEGSYTQKMFKLEEILDYIKMTLHIFEGDIVFTGTPSGVGSIKKGNLIQVELLLEGTILTNLNCEVC